MLPSRRLFIKAGTALVAGAPLFGTRSCPALAQDPTPLDVAYAGSMTSLMEGPIKQLAAQRLNLALQGRAQGASGLAALIAGGNITPDVFISVTASPIETVIKAGKVEAAQPIARTEMVIAYSPKSSFAQKLSNAGKKGNEAWWQVLEEPGLRFGRTDPVTDPQGRNIIFLIQLAASLYNQPDLRDRILGADNNPSQIFTEPSIEARLQSVELDAASAYKIQPEPFGLPYIGLPAEINLSDSRRQADYAKASLTLGGKLYHPEPLVYYAAVVKGSAHPNEAAAFVKWLGDAEAQAAFRRYSYDPAGNAASLHA